MKNKIIAILCFMLLLLQLPAAASAQASGIAIAVDGTKLALPQPAVVQNGTTLVPAGPIFKQLGLTLAFDKASQTVKGSKEGLIINLGLGNRVASVNGVTVIMSVPAQVINGATMVPLRFVSDCLGASVTSDPKTKLISIKTGKAATKFQHGLPLVISGNYVRNIAKTNFLYVTFVDFFYDTEKQAIVEYEQSVSDLGAGSTVKYTEYQVQNLSYNGAEVYMGTVVKRVKDYGNNVQENPNYDKIRAYYRTGGYLDQIRSIYQDYSDAVKAALKKELQANKNKPLKVTDASISYNSIGIPEANITVKNLTEKTVIAYEISFSCYDDFERPVNVWLGSSNRVDGIAQDISISSGGEYGASWTLNLYTLTTHLKNVRITAVRFSDGTTWKA
ncbi:copper amine oxidase N-terminal domain-containing protein [Paenibacillus lycopersici]|uniref:Copper amine oxidase N-terminal domain-containing protein n=1 Tax=Paenibacillus lycopersici TaxID=2704462 RepID=A0A6C0G713_9BACL|nr:stalk domain-containing protein [Paenibacillus lycopersici]QHT62535.1 copper amine oxidase N-terminal domain-containing protein [Paenibacillus lycopersici]